MRFLCITTTNTTKLMAKTYSNNQLQQLKQIGSVPEAHVCR